MTDETDGADEMDDGLCPGPHLVCGGCAGVGAIAGEVLYVSRHGRAEGRVAEHRCRSCCGRGFFCQYVPACRGLHDARTVAINPSRIPPV